MGKTIIHCDMDAFFASVEQLDHPELASQAVLVGGSRDRGVVCAASYQARPAGVRSGMSMREAVRRCPQAVIMPVRMSRYQEVSEQIFRIFADYSDLVEALSIDEAFIDVSGCRRLLGSGVEIAREIRNRVREELGLAVSAGVAPNKFLAKLASDEAKPDGLLEISENAVDAFLLPLDIGKLWGVGRVTAEKLRAMGVHRIADLRQWPRQELERRFGSSGANLYFLARGVDRREVVPGRKIQSIGAEETFASDLQDLEEIRRELLSQAERVARRVRKKGLAATGMTLKLKFADFSSISRSTGFASPVCEAEQVWKAALRLLETTDAVLRPVRLSGIYLTGLVPPGASQQDLFPDLEQERRGRLTGAIDELQDRFGEKVTHRATLLGRRGSVQHGKEGKHRGE